MSEKHNYAVCPLPVTHNLRLPSSLCSVPPMLASINGSLKPLTLFGLGFARGENSGESGRNGVPQFWGSCWLHHSDFPTLRSALGTIRPLNVTMC